MYFDIGTAARPGSPADPIATILMSSVVSGPDAPGNEAAVKTP
jgi:hypothetical protein